MMTETQIEDPRSSRIVLTEANGETVLLIPPQRTIFTVSFLLIWLGFWTYGGIEAAQSFLAADGRLGGRAFLGLWLCGWLFGEITAGFALIWMFFGMEVVTVSRSVLKLSKTLLFLSRSKVYSSAFITNMRWETVPARRTGDRTQLSFNYGAKTISFASGCDQGEGQHIISKLTDRLGLNRQESLATKERSEAA